MSCPFRSLCIWDSSALPLASIAFICNSVMPIIRGSARGVRISMVWRSACDRADANAEQWRRQGFYVGQIGGQGEIDDRVLRHASPFCGGDLQGDEDGLNPDRWCRGTTVRCNRAMPGWDGTDTWDVQVRPALLWHGAGMPAAGGAGTCPAPPVTWQEDREPVSRGHLEYDLRTTTISSQVPSSVDGSRSAGNSSGLATMLSCESSPMSARSS